MSTAVLEQGVIAVRAGRRVEGRALLMQVIETDERNIQAWLWLSGVVDTPEEQRICLENVLQIDPGNLQAQRGLAWLDSQVVPAAASSPQPEQTQAAAATIVASELPAIAAPPPSAPAETAEMIDPEALPCPYCGEPNGMRRRSCGNCGENLMIRIAPGEQRSIYLSILGGLWMLGGILTMLLALGLLVLLNIGATGRGGRGGSSFLLVIVPIVILGITGLVQLSIARGLLRRRRWAYYLTVFLGILGTIGTVMRIIAGAIVMQSVVSQVSSTSKIAVQTATTVIGALLLCITLFQLLYLLLIVASYRDFFGPKVRFQAKVFGRDDREHFNKGLAYKQRQMWYMALQEWEAAVNKSPRDPDYLHALGLACAQLNQFDRARSMLDTAIEIAPHLINLHESRALVDRMAARAGV